MYHTYFTEQLTGLLMMDVDVSSDPARDYVWRPAAVGTAGICLHFLAVWPYLGPLIAHLVPSYNSVHFLHLFPFITL